MTKKCCICGCEFEVRMKTQVTCGNAECKRLQHIEYMKGYVSKNRPYRRTYNRDWMREYRRRQGKEEEPRQTEPGANADSYAERQKRKTLEMAGKVKL